MLSSSRLITNTKRQSFNIDIFLPDQSKGLKASSSSLSSNSRVIRKQNELKSIQLIKQSMYNSHGILPKKHSVFVTEVKTKPVNLVFQGDTGNSNNGHKLFGA